MNQMPTHKDSRTKSPCNNTTALPALSSQNHLNPPTHEAHLHHDEIEGQDSCRRTHRIGGTNKQSDLQPALM